MAKCTGKKDLNKFLGDRQHPFGLRKEKRAWKIEIEPIKDIRDTFRQTKENKAIKDTIIMDIGSVFEKEKEDR